jgi:L-threonylcarbamoyladenylate synthase
MKVFQAPEGISVAVEALCAGKIVCYPTETFYALGIDFQNPLARDRLFAAKQRPQEKDLPLIASDMQMVSQVCDTDDARLHLLAERFWPGPLTIVMSDRTHNGSVAIRISSHAVARLLARSFGAPVVSTSANLSGAPPVAEAALLDESMRQSIEVLLDQGPCAGGKASTIVSLLETPARILREGAIPSGEILSLLYSS